MADRTFFQDVFERNSSADARNHHLDGTGNRIFERCRNYLFFRCEFDSFDILLFNPRRSINHRAFFRTARRQRLRGRGGFDSVFYSADYFDVSDKSVSENSIKDDNLDPAAKVPNQAEEIEVLMNNGKKWGNFILVKKANCSVRLKFETKTVLR